MATTAKWVELPAPENSWHAVDTGRRQIRSFGDIWTDGCIAAIGEPVGIKPHKPAVAGPQDGGRRDGEERDHG